MVDATAAVCIMSPSPKLFPFLLSYRDAKSCRRHFLSQITQPSLCYVAQLGGLFKRLVEALAYSALTRCVLAVLLFWALVILQYKRDGIDEEAQLMYDAINARPSSTQG